MSYELAKQLKDAGFPQQTKAGYNLDGIVYPTLEELIEACGRELYFLRYNVDETWTCAGETVASAQDGKTPTEAVAKLWLALQES